MISLSNTILFHPPRFNPNVSLTNLIYIPNQSGEAITHIPAKFLEYNSNKFFIMFHGNSESILEHQPAGEIISYMFKANVILVEYPSYSIYDAQINPNKILADALVVYDYLYNELTIPPENIYVIGRSIGTAPATYLAKNRELSGLLLISPFSSIKEVAASKTFFNMGACFNNLEIIKHVKCPTLFIHGKKDSLIPVDHTRTLYGCAGSIKDKLVKIETDDDHNSFQWEDIGSKLDTFISEKIPTFKEDEAAKFKIPDEIKVVPSCFKTKIDSILQTQNQSAFNFNSHSPYSSNSLQKESNCKVKSTQPNEETKNKSFWNYFTWPFNFSVNCFRSNLTKKVSNCKVKLTRLNAEQYFDYYVKSVSYDEKLNKIILGLTDDDDFYHMLLEFLGKDIDVKVDLYKNLIKHEEMVDNKYGVKDKKKFEEIFNFINKKNEYDESFIRQLIKFILDEDDLNIKK